VQALRPLLNLRDGVQGQELRPLLRDGVPGRGLHSSTFQLNLSPF
jgi:hypothetical protein